ncbi:MAG TPA: hypothetical protein PKA61_07555 [Nitrospira sp.]|nr:hypothetical protein [Nitrospira sp.]
MSATIPSTEPSSFRAGDFLTWTKSLADYPANQGWSLAYTLINASSKITINAGTSGADFLVSVPAATTAAYTAGIYQWMARVTKSTEIYTVASGTIEILPNLAAATTFDVRSHAKIMLDAIEAAFEGKASSTQLEMEINGRRIKSFSPEEMIRWRSYYKMEVAKEADAESLARTGINRRRIGVRFSRV